ncbi:MAG: hypothetical protein IPH41_18655 [Sulfuritalea sp.]|nr:hypothetical protein [Sulfuritalea sp.]
MSYYWMFEHRALRAELIRRWKPWEKSTGPKSEAGKARSAQRGFKGGWRGRLRELAHALREQAETLKRIGEEVGTHGTQTMLARTDQGRK